MFKKVIIPFALLAIVCSFFSGIKFAKAIAECAAVSQPVPVITVNGTQYTGTNNTISGTAGQTFSISWDSDVDPLSDTIVGYYSGHTAFTSQGSRTTDPVPSSGTVVLASVTGTWWCTGTPPPAGTSTVSVAVSGGPVGGGPTVDMVGSPTAMFAGNSTTLTWEVSGSPDSCVASGGFGWSGAVNNANGQHNFTTQAINASGDYTFTIQCSKSGFPPVTASVSVNVANPAEISISASPNILNASDPPASRWTTITPTGNDKYTCTASTSATVNQNTVQWNGNVPTQVGFAQAVGPVAAIGQTYTFTMSCNRRVAPNDLIATVSTNVTVLGTQSGFDLSCTPGSIVIEQGDTATFVVGVSPSGGFTGTVSLSAFSSPPGPTVSAPSPSTISSPYSSGSTVVVTTTGSTATGDYTIFVNGTSGSDSGACGITLTVTTSGGAVPSVSISASPTSVAAGGTSTITWVVANATSCTASATPANTGWTGSVSATTGSHNTTSGAINSSTIFSIVCSGPGGVSPQANASVSVGAPTVDLKGSATSGGSYVDGPISVDPFTAAYFSWSSSGATSCSMSPALSGGAIGTSQAGPPGRASNSLGSQSTTFTLTCINATGGSASDSVQVNVNGSPTVDLKISGTSALGPWGNGPLVVSSGTSVWLQWTGSATSCSATSSPVQANWNGAKNPPIQTQSMGALSANQTYTILCNNGSNESAIDSVQVNIASCPSNPVVLSQSSVDVTQTVTASAPGYTGGTFVSSNTSVASVSGSTVTGVEGGSANITGTGWTHTATGATGCSLSAAALTVRGYTISVTPASQTINAESGTTLVVNIVPVNGATMPVTVNITNKGSMPSGWSIAPSLVPLTVNAGGYGNFVLTTTRIATPTTFVFNFSATYNSYNKTTTASVTVSPPPPLQPTNLTVDNQAACGEIYVNWDAPAGGATGYKVYRSIDGTNWLQIGTTAATDYNDADPLLTSSQFYFYGVVAYNASGDSPRTETITPIFPTVCSTNFTGTNKYISAVNGTATSGGSACVGSDSVTGLPQALKGGDIIRFTVHICNSTGTEDTKDLTVVDTLTNLINPSNFDYSSGSKNCVELSQNISVGGDVITILLKDLAKNDSCEFSFEAEVAPPTAGSTNFEFQNTIEVYNNSAFAYRFRTGRYTSIRTPLDPKKVETF